MSQISDKDRKMLETIAASVTAVARVVAALESNGTLQKGEIAAALRKQAATSKLSDGEALHVMAHLLTDLDKRGKDGLGLLEYKVTYVNAKDGDFHQYFFCHAVNEQHAKEQCLNAYPDCQIIEVTDHGH